MRTQSGRRARLLAAVALALGLAACAPPPPGGLVVISFDTTRRDHLSMYGYHRETTPRLDRLAADGALFDNAIAQQNRTLPSHASMLSGLYPHGHDSYSNQHILPESTTTLAEILGAAGFRTAAFVSGYTMRANWGLDQGFEVYDDAFDGMARQGEASVTAARRWLDGLDAGERFFLFLHLYDAHGPYRTPGGRVDFRSDEPGPRLSGIADYQLLHGEDGEPLEHLNDYIDRYDTLIRYQDELVGRLLEKVDPATTVVVFTSDHGETLNERSQVLNHGAALFEEEIRIPLLIAGVGIPARRIEAAVETVDLLPTLLEVLGVAAPEDLALHGSSLLDLVQGDDAGAADRVVFASSVAEPHRFADRGYELDTRRQIQVARAWPWKLIVYPHERRDYIELYHLGADPLERHDVAGQHPEVRDRLRQALRAWNPGYRRPVPLANISDEERERLRALGYIR